MAKSTDAPASDLCNQIRDQRDKLINCMQVLFSNIFKFIFRIKIGRSDSLVDMIGKQITD